MYKNNIDSGYVKWKKVVILMSDNFTIFQKVRVGRAHELYV